MPRPVGGWARAHVLTHAGRCHLETDDPCGRGGAGAHARQVFPGVSESGCDRELVEMLTSLMRVQAKGSHPN